MSRYYCAYTKNKLTQSNGLFICTVLDFFGKFSQIPQTEAKSDPVMCTSIVQETPRLHKSVKQTEISDSKTQMVKSLCRRAHCKEIYIIITIPSSNQDDC